MRRWVRLKDSYMEEYRARGLSEQTVEHTESRLDRRGRWLKKRPLRVVIEHIAMRVSPFFERSDQSAGGKSGRLPGLRIEQQAQRLLLFRRGFASSLPFTLSATAARMRSFKAASSSLSLS